MKKITAIIITALLTLGMFPIVSAAVDGTITADGTYDIHDYGNSSTITINPGLNVILTNTGGTQFQNMKITCGAGTALTVNNIDINNSATDGSCPISFSGIGNTLTLTGTNTFIAGEGMPGIHVSGGASLEIMGPGSVDVTGGRNGAGIGAGYNEAGGSITISGGTITATGGLYSAGIGMGRNSSFKRSGGSITITGGSIHAAGNNGGSGIGGGWWSGAGNIKIEGGTIHAESTSSGAAIGSGYQAGTPGTILISGGTVDAIASSGANCAGLGAGNWSNGLSITIEGGTVTAVGGARGAGIGGAFQKGAGTITITGGTIYASRGLDDGSIGTDLNSHQDIGSGKDGSGGSFNISGNTAIFLKSDTYLTPTTTSHQHFVINETDNVYGYTIPADYSHPFGAFFALYTLSYDVNDGYGTVVDPITQIVDSTTNVADDSGISRYSYTFGGWATVNDGSGKVYQPGDTFTFANDTTLYAKWDEIPVDSVTLNKTSLNLIHHDTDLLTTVVLPVDATHPEVTWTSSNSSVVTIDNSGNVVAAGVGDAVITGTADGVSAECSVTVNKKPVESVTPSQMSLTLVHHDEVSLTAQVLPANASYPDVAWTSSHDSVVTIDSGGNVVATGVGSASITATADGISEICTVTVNKKPVDSVTLSQETMTMLHHDTAVLTAAVLPDNATYPEVTWETSNSAVATVDQEGNIEAVGLGSATITATADGVSDTCVITVNKRSVSSVSLSKNTLTMEHHDTTELIAEVLPDNATYPEVTWETSNSAVATVDQEGNIEAVGLGSATITATADGISDTCSITVNKKPVDSVIINNETLTMEHHDSAKLTAAVLPLNATYPEVTWESSDDTIVTVSQNGDIEAISLGHATITATADGISNNCEVTVTKKPVASVTLNNTDETVFVGETVILTKTVLPVNATYPEATWESSDETVAAVDDKGIVTTIKGGRVTITATADQISASCNIFVIQPVTNVTMSSEFKTMIHHDTLTLSAEVLPDDATYPEVTWTTSNRNVAVVNQNGKVTAVGLGSAKITSTADGISDICNIVVDKKPVTDVLLNEEELKLIHHDDFILTAEVIPSHATYPEVTWESSDTSVIAVDEEGHVSAVGLGSAKIIAAADGIRTVCSVTVEKKPVTSVVLNETEITLVKDDTFELAASVMPNNATYTDVAWVSSDPSVVEVDKTGVITAIGLGSAVVTAQADGIASACEVTVQPVSEKTVTITGVLIDNSGNPLAGQVVELHSNPMTAITDEEGRFTFEGVYVEKHTLVFLDTAGKPVKEFTINLDIEEEFKWDEDENACINIMLSKDTAAVELSISSYNEDFGIIDVQEVTYSIESSDSIWKYVVIAATVLLAVLVGIYAALKVKMRSRS